MHIGFITPEYPHPEVQKAAGMGTSIRNLVHALVAKGVQVTLFVYGQQESKVFQEEGVSFHLIAHKKYTALGWFYYRKYLQRYIENEVKQQAIQLLEAPDWTGITAFMKFSVPLIIRFHGSDTYFCYLEKRPQKWKNRFFEKRAVLGAQGYIAPTTFAGLKSAQLFGIPPQKVTTLHYGLDLSLFQNSNPDTFEPFRILNVGTLIRKKGVFQLVEMFNRIVAKQPKATLYFIGGDSKDIQTGSHSTWKLLQARLSPQAELQTTYLGKIPYEEVQKEMVKAHLCIYPSMAETLGMVTIESMALQKAVLNTNYGWAEDLIDDGVNGFLIDPNNIDGYVQTVLELFEDSKKTLSIGKAAKLKVETTFVVEKIVHQNIKYYQKWLSE